MASVVAERGVRKAMGTHYTPALLADFLAERVQAALGDSATQALRILDPACGDGRLLDAFLSTAGKAGRSVGAVVGVDADQSALAAASERLGELLPPPQLIHGDFLDLRTPVAGQRELWEPRAPRAEFDLGFDVVIANPPYVRTQVLGSERSVELARRFLLSGRVDLYQAFVVAATDVLRVGGLAGIILSNRFLITRGCSAFRRYLDQNYEIEEVIDLGDTKLFEAAVLPSIFIGRRRTTSGPAQARRIGRFTKVYSQPNGAGPGLNTAPSLPSVYAMLRLEQSGVYRVPEGSFAVTMGPLILDADAGQEWRLTTTDESRWLRRVQASAAGLFGEIAEVRVGIKTTADEVFIRSDWEALPEGTRPEPALLRPLLRHDDARRWSLPRDSAPTARILYPHEVVDGRRSVVDLVRYPRAKAYLELHEERLRRRHYVEAAGRKWYEVWVPQDPAAWALPKLVFPDISPEPLFFLDRDGRLVDGNCYWITLKPGVDERLLYLLLAVANSSLLAKYHDLAFNNRLYARRRRYITQYVARYRYPDPRLQASRELMSLVEQACDAREAAPDLERRVDELVEFAFGIQSGEEISQ